MLSAEAGAERAFRQHRRVAFGGRWVADTAWAVLPLLLFTARAVFPSVEGVERGAPYISIFCLLLLERLVGIPAVLAREGTFLARHAAPVHAALMLSRLAAVVVGEAMMPQQGHFVLASACIVVRPLLEPTPLVLAQALPLALGAWVARILTLLVRHLPSDPSSSAAPAVSTVPLWQSTAENAQVCLGLAALALGVLAVLYVRERERRALFDVRPLPPPPPLVAPSVQQLLGSAAACSATVWTVAG